MPLLEIVKNMIDNNHKSYEKLERGLVIAFTPEPSDNNPNSPARFVWSRKDAIPSETEDEILRKCVLVSLAMDKNYIVTHGPIFRDMQQLKDGWMSSVMTWRRAPSHTIFNLPEKQRENSLNWFRPWADNLDQLLQGHEEEE